MRIEVAYAQPSEQIIVGLDVGAETTVEAAIKLSGLPHRFPEIDLGRDAVGIFSKPCALNHRLREGDRVEIYRPLFADPKEARRSRAAKSSNPS
jgi:putative ubiquitin-RnfH superfamily antitoxin RatB of RatAB toxin-antitoxin module